MPETIISPKFERQKAYAELTRRQHLQVPPGFKDAGKDDLGIGDLLIWFAVLEIGAKNKKPLIFVSGEEKADWQHRSGGAGFLPRYELLDEYRRSSAGQPFYIVPLSKLLELLNVQKESVEQIKHEEERLLEASTLNVKCPSCENDVACRLGEYIGATTRPRCPECSILFYVHRTRSGVIVRESRVHRPRSGVIVRESLEPESREEDDGQPAEVTCPNCDSSVKTILGNSRNATRWCICTECDTRFPIHRRMDGEILVSRAARIIE